MTPPLLQLWKVCSNGPSGLGMERRPPFPIRFSPLRNAAWTQTFANRYPHKIYGSTAFWNGSPRPIYICTNTARVIWAVLRNLFLATCYGMTSLLYRTTEHDTSPKAVYIQSLTCCNGTLALNTALGTWTLCATLQCYALFSHSLLLNFRPLH